MKKIISKISVLFAGLLLLCTLAACEKFDASSYVQAILDYLSGMSDSYALKVFEELISY